MGGLRTLALMLWLCTLSADRIGPTATGDVIAEAEVPTVRIALTAFSVGDESLELSYKIVNASGHDVWICDAVYRRDKPLPPLYEVYMEEDGQTLVVRKQIEVPRLWVSVVPRRYAGRYVLLRPGQERIESFSLSVPVDRCPIFAMGGPYAKHATRLRVKIGFFDEDLPQKIRRIIELAESLACTQPSYPEMGAARYDLYMGYFQGLWISDTFGGLSGFDNVWAEGSEQIEIPYASPALLGEESCFEIVIDGVFISLDPY